MNVIAETKELKTHFQKIIILFIQYIYYKKIKYLMVPIQKNLKRLVYAAFLDSSLSEVLTLLCQFLRKVVQTVQMLQQLVDILES